MVGHTTEQIKSMVICATFKYDEPRLQVSHECLTAANRQAHTHTDRQRSVETFLAWCSNGMAQLQLLACRRLFHSTQTDCSSTSNLSTATAADEPSTHPPSNGCPPAPLSKPESALAQNAVDSSWLLASVSGCRTARKSIESDALSVCSAVDSDSAL